MELFEILKQLKKIEPNPSWTENSRRTILASVPLEAFSFRQIATHVFETAGSLVLAGALILLVAGGFSSSGYLSPVHLSVIDPITLHAEAQAIDMQINLLNLNYTENTNGAASTPSVAATGPRKIAAIANTSTTNATTTASSTEPTSISIDQALQQLTK